MTIRIDYPGQLYGYDLEEIAVHFHNRFVFQDAAFNFELVDAMIMTKTNGTEATSDKTGLGIAGLVVMIITTPTVIFGTIGMLLGMSFGIAFDFIITLQMIHLIPCMQIYLPTGLMQMF